jgi:RNA polymerase sigma-70 factor (ECF subfamily)
MSSGEDLAGLAKRARDGDSDAWADIYKMMAPSIFRLCRRALATRQDAEDATGEVFLKARLRLPQYDDARPFEPWLFRVAANHCWDELRRRNPRRQVEDSEAELSKLAADAPSPQEAVLLSESKRNIRRAVAELDERSRLVVALRYYADMSYAEIGDVLGISANFTGVLLLRARRALRKRLSS